MEDKYAIVWEFGFLNFLLRFLLNSYKTNVVSTDDGMKYFQVYSPPHRGRVYRVILQITLKYHSISSRTSITTFVSRGTRNTFPYH